MKFFLLAILIVTGLLFACVRASSAGEPVKRPLTPAQRAIAPAAPEQSIAAIRAMLLERKRALRDEMQKSMPFHEKKIRERNADYEMKKEMYEKNLISRTEIDDSAQALAGARLDAAKLREWIAEDNRALALAVGAVEESRELPKGNVAAAAITRFEGAVNWSIQAFEKIDSFYRRQFGRPPPISAMGQSHTHDRLGLDHRDAVDVAVRPDSVEGRALMDYLRRMKIPFIAFSGISSMSTGAHIHIGRPSPRLLEVRQGWTPAQARIEEAEHG